ncbi:hypothetical protein LRS10_12355 [Phenylobacterium sp. J426]|nr:hypothetical protein [Phenylobacterium sp. J426]MCR5874895.1 hypothetical protein [Phenylobacterium sp. J426]
MGAAGFESRHDVQELVTCGGQVFQPTDHKLVAGGDEVEDRGQDGRRRAFGQGGFGPDDLASEVFESLDLLAQVRVAGSNVADLEHAAL